MKKILILSVNQKNTENLQLDEEIREIEKALKIGNGEQFKVIIYTVVGFNDLQRVLLEQQPTIVHFSGHGSRSTGLALENDCGQMQLVSAESLAQLFELFGENIECVLLNACYNEEQGKAIHQHIDYVIGINQAIGNKAAIKFVIGFYNALERGKPLEDCFEFGCCSISLQGIPESSSPVLKAGRRRYSQRKITPNPESKFFVKPKTPEKKKLQSILNPVINKNGSSGFVIKNNNQSEQNIKQIIVEPNTEDMKDLIKESSEQLKIWEKIWDKATEVETEPSEGSKAMYPVLLNENLDILHPTICIPNKRHIIFKIKLECEGYLLLLEKDTLEKIWCMCPSRVAPESKLLKEGTKIPQEGNKGKRVKEGWLEVFSLRVSGIGHEQVLAIVTEKSPKLNWLEDAKNPIGSTKELSTGELLELLKYVEDNSDCQVYKMIFEVE